MSKSNIIDKYREQLFNDSTAIEMTPNEALQLKRYRAVFSFRLDTPTVSNKELATFLQTEFGISQSQAYRDIANTEQIFGSIVNAQKEWTRYLVVETLKEAITLARAEGDIKEMIRAATSLGVVSRLDKEDAQRLPYDEIVPSDIEYANDPSLVGGKKVDNPRALIDKVLKKYIDDVDFEEVKHE